MKHRIPQRLNRKIGVIGFGAWQLYNPEFFGDMAKEEAIALVQAAVKQGVNLFDTAPGYGGGNSERILGEALKPYRLDVFINTKFGHTVDNKMDFSINGLNESLIGSLNRLQTDYVDGIILHNPGRELLYDGPLYERLRELKQDGTIRGFGVSIDSLEELDIVLHHNDVDIIELMFNIIHQSPKALFDEVKQRGILLMIKIPLDSGWLTGKYTKDTVHTGIRARWTPDVITTRLAIVDQIKAILGTNDITQDSLRFVLAHDAVTAVIPGVRNLRQLASNVAAQEQDMNPETVEQLNELYDTFIKHLHTPW